MSNENSNSNQHDEKRSMKDEYDESATPDDIDDSKVKFLNGKQGLDEQCVVEVGSEVSFNGLGKEELMKYANDPFWVRTRLILLVIFWVGWVAMLVAAVVIIVLAPKCPERPNLKWYQSDVIYQINPKSFKDSQTLDKDGKAEDGAGIGDLSGISDKIDYLQSLGVNSLWVNSFYKSGVSSYEFHDVADFKQVDETVGTMAAFDNLRKSLKKKGMRLIMDFIPNHSGKKHEWFMESQNKTKGFEDFYIWADGTGSNPTKNPPNNWVTVYNKPAWTYDATRGQWYYHSYLPDYPDLNLRNEMVLSKMDDVLKFWLDKGVDGFTIQGLQRLVESNDTKNEAIKGESTVDQPENMELVKRWRNIVNSYSNKPGRERALFADVMKKGNNTDEYYKAGLHIVMSHALLNVDPGACDQECLKDRLVMATADGHWNGWMVDNENNPRFGSLVSDTLQKAWQVLHLLLPGTPFVYYGDEIAMTNGVVSSSLIKDPVATQLGQPSRDPYRTPMLWSNGINAGFSVNGTTPWLPVNGDSISKNVEFNSAHLVGYTALRSFKDLVSLRSKESFQFGNIEMGVLHDDILYFTRKATGFPSYLVAINRGAKTAAFGSIASKLTLRYDSSGADNVGKVYDTSVAPIGFSDGEVYVFEF